MLKKLPALLTPDALHALASMGHGDEVVIADAHFPAARLAAAGTARLVDLAGADAPQVLAAFLQVLPLDTGEEAAWTMQVIGQPDNVPPAVAALRRTLVDAGERPAGALDRFAFYERAARAFVIVRTGETRTYGNLLLRKGVAG